MLDGFIMLALMLPLQWMTGALEDFATRSVLANAAWGGVGLLLYLPVQGYFLATRAQTLGKMALGIKIVTLDGENADLKRILLLRVLPVTLVSVVPGIGSVLSTLDALFIFRADQRCIHDHIAGTRVVNV